MELEPCRHSGWLSAPPPSLTSHQKFWLLRPGALTGGLRQLGSVDLRVMREKVAGLHADEAWMLARPAHSPIWLREICMAIDGIDSVYARSFTPLAASHALWQGMRRLRTRPLADMLYHDPQITRSRFFVCRLHRQHPLYRSMQLQLGPGCPPAQSVLARCSVFWRLNEPLLVAEAFLPAFWRIAGHSRP
ncbi:chorismate lyase [Yanghanlia caeni]|uniref:Probable chorismate pyruvate-lyase n=1 Tax=Yanghanlia caeni TaxID=3064283 RepID=A0ABU1D5Z8_9BURK|nr:chorismate lyase [Alcaligenaceae bacterium LG-2]NGR06460.1 chorismate lyase [bacterium SGD-2]HZH55749.1 chorismate lyase [Burkholderiaceae bacterium]